MLLSPDERDHLQSTTRTLLARESPDDALWQQMVELGWTAIHVPAQDGGAGYGFADVAIVLHELGRALVSSPFLASAVLATGALGLADNSAVAREALAVLTSGEAWGAVAFAGTHGSYDVTRLTTSWTRAGGSVALRGSSGFVLDADLAAVLVVAARASDGTVAVVAVDTDDPNVRIEHAPTVDETRRLFTVTFEDVTVAEDRLLCEPGAAAEELLDRVLAIGAIAAACDATGAAGHVLEQAAAYAKERTQFGRPIGSFQAVKHHCADMAIAVEASRAATNAAVKALDGDRAEWATTAAVTASYVGPACAEVCALGLLVHGGIGFTWEHDSHRYLKRVKLDEVLFGTPSWHRRRLARAVFPKLVAS